MTTPSLDELLVRLCNGDNEAAEQVFVIYEPYLRKVVRRQLPSRLRTRFDSMDIVQSIWSDLLDGFRSAGWRFASSAQLQAFLVKVTRNRFLDRVRQHGRAVDREEQLSEVDPPDISPRHGSRSQDLWPRPMNSGAPADSLSAGTSGTVETQAQVFLCGNCCADGSSCR